MDPATRLAVGYECLSTELIHFQAIFENLLEFARVVEHTQLELTAKQNIKATIKPLPLVGSNVKQIRHKPATASIRQSYQKHASTHHSTISFLSESLIAQSTNSTYISSPLSRLSSKPRASHQVTSNVTSLHQPSIQSVQIKRHPLAYSNSSPIHHPESYSPVVEINADYSQDKIDPVNVSTYQNVFLDMTLIESPQKKRMSKKLFRFGWMKR